MPNSNPETKVEGALEPARVVFKYTSIDVITFQPNHNPSPNPKSKS